MSGKIRFVIVLGIMTTLWNAALWSQDSARIIILSGRVGPVIDLAERDRFRIFNQFEDFSSATVFQRKDSTFFVRIQRVKSGGLLRDSLIDYPPAVLFMMAEKINHFEEVESSSYRFGTDPPVLIYADGIAVPAASPPPPPANHPIISSSPQSIVRLRPDPLPLVPDSINEDVFDDGYLNWWLGVGISRYAPDFSGIRAAYRDVESVLQSEGNPVSLGDPSFSSSAILLMDIRLGLSRQLLGIVEAGTQISGDVDFKSVALSIQYMFPPSQSIPVRPFVEAGVGRYKIHAEQPFNIGLKSGATFDAMIVDVTHFGYIATIGMETGKKSILSIGMSYLYVPEMHQTTPLGTETSFNMSSLLITAKLLLLW